MLQARQQQQQKSRWRIKHTCTHSFCLTTHALLRLSHQDTEHPRISISHVVESRQFMHVAGVLQQQQQESRRRIRKLEAQEAVSQGKLAQQKETIDSQQQQLQQLQVGFCRPCLVTHP